MGAALAPQQPQVRGDATADDTLLVLSSLGPGEEPMECDDAFTLEALSRLLPSPPSSRGGAITPVEPRALMESTLQAIAQGSARLPGFEHERELRAVALAMEIPEHQAWLERHVLVPLDRDYVFVLTAGQVGGSRAPSMDVTDFFHQSRGRFPKLPIRPMDITTAERLLLSSPVEERAPAFSFPVGPGPPRAQADPPFRAQDWLSAIAAVRAALGEDTFAALAPSTERAWTDYHDRAEMLTRELRRGASQRLQFARSLGSGSDDLREQGALYTGEHGQWALYMGTTFIPPEHEVELTYFSERSLAPDVSEVDIPQRFRISSVVPRGCPMGHAFVPLVLSGTQFDSRGPCPPAVFPGMDPTGRVPAFVLHRTPEEVDDAISQVVPFLERVAPQILAAQRFLQAPTATSDPLVEFALFPLGFRPSGYPPKECWLLTIRVPHLPAGPMAALDSPDLDTALHPDVARPWETIGRFYDLFGKSPAPPEAELVSGLFPYAWATTPISAVPVVWWLVTEDATPPCLRSPWLEQETAMEPLSPRILLRSFVLRGREDAGVSKRRLAAAASLLWALTAIGAAVRGHALSGQVDIGGPPEEVMPEAAPMEGAERCASPWFPAPAPALVRAHIRDAALEFATSFGAYASAVTNAFRLILPTLSLHLPEAWESGRPDPAPPTRREGWLGAPESAKVLIGAARSLVDRWNAVFEEASWPTLPSAARLAPGGLFGPHCRPHPSREDALGLSMGIRRGPDGFPTWPLDIYPNVLDFEEPEQKKVAEAQRNKLYTAGIFFLQPHVAPMVDQNKASWDVGNVLASFKDLQRTARELVNGHYQPRGALARLARTDPIFAPLAASVPQPAFLSTFVVDFAPIGMQFGNRSCRKTRRQNEILLDSLHNPGPAYAFCNVYPNECVARGTARLVGLVVTEGTPVLQQAARTVEDWSVYQRGVKSLRERHWDTLTSAYGLTRALTEEEALEALHGPLPWVPRDDADWLTACTALTFAWASGLALEGGTRDPLGRPLHLFGDDDRRPDKVLLTHQISLAHYILAGPGTRGNRQVLGTMGAWAAHGLRSSAPPSESWGLALPPVEDGGDIAALLPPPPRVSLFARQGDPLTQVTDAALAERVKRFLVESVQEGLFPSDQEEAAWLLQATTTSGPGGGGAGFGDPRRRWARRVCETVMADTSIRVINVETLSWRLPTDPEDQRRHLFLEQGGFEVAFSLCFHSVTVHTYTDDEEGENEESFWRAKLGAEGSDLETQARVRLTRLVRDLVVAFARNPHQLGLRDRHV